jgi:hypothetical protein
MAGISCFGGKVKLKVHSGWKVVSQFWMVIFLLLSSCQNVPLRTSVPIQKTTSVPVEQTGTPITTEALPQATVVPPAAVTASDTLVNGYLTATELDLREANRISLDPLAWSSWPIIPTFNPFLIQVYQRGLEKGKAANRFSVLGDCQSLPNVFMGMFDTREVSFSESEAGLHETIDYYQGSFSHQSLTVIDGLSPSTALSPLWNDPSVCGVNESPLKCELRMNQPSLLLINLGSNWKLNASLDSFEKYMRQIIETSLAEGVIPVLSTKADNVEGGHRINALFAKLADEYQIPVWNFWRAADTLENHGLDFDRGNIYLTTDAWSVRSFAALRVLDALHRFLLDGPE